MDMFKLILICVNQGPSWWPRSYRFQFWPQSSCLSSWCSGSNRLWCLIFCDWKHCLSLIAAPSYDKQIVAKNIVSGPNSKFPRITQEQELYSWWLSLRQLKYNFGIVLMYSNQSLFFQLQNVEQPALAPNLTTHGFEVHKTPPKLHVSFHHEIMVEGQ